MPLSSTDAVALVADELLPAWRKERTRLDWIDRWMRWKQEDIKLPRKATPELKKLAELSKTPWLALVVSTVSQCMCVDGHRSPRDAARPDGEESATWRTWRANKMAVRQTAVHRAAVGYGYAFVTVLPGEDATGPRSVMRGVSPRKMYAAYEDPAEDDWPQYAIRVEKSGGGLWVRLYDDDLVHSFDVATTGGKPVVRGPAASHGAGLCPVVRYCNKLDAEGRADGEVEPYIGAAARINKTAYDRLLTQHYASWKVRTIAGLAEPDTEEAANRKKLELRQDDILVAEDPDTKFGTLDETPLGGFIDSWRADIEALAAVSQTPTHALTGQLINVNAEALAATRAGLTQKVSELQTSLGGSHDQSNRLAAALEGRTEDANDVFGHVTWQDMEVRSISQAVDAYGKAAQMLGVPVQALWARIPGVTKTDVDEWELMVAKDDPLKRYAKVLDDQAADPPADSAA